MFEITNSKLTPNANTRNSTAPDLSCIFFSIEPNLATNSDRILLIVLKLQKIINQFFLKHLNLAPLLIRTLQKTFKSKSVLDSIKITRYPLWIRSVPTLEYNRKRRVIFEKKMKQEWVEFCLSKSDLSRSSKKLQFAYFCR